MQAVILAAGNGSRLAAATGGGSKCLVDLGGVSILEYQLAVLRSLDVDRICVVLGHDADSVRAHLGADCTALMNHRYRETNSLYSFSLTRDWVREDFFLSNCDVVADLRIYRRLLDTPGNALAYDSRSGREDEHMKIARDVDARLRAISKSLPQAIVHGESVGLLKFSASARSHLFRQVDLALQAGGERQWAPAAFDRLAGIERIACVDVAGLPWAEIDLLEDLEHARSRVWPRLEPVGDAAGTPLVASL